MAFRRRKCARRRQGSRASPESEIGVVVPAAGRMEQGLEEATEGAVSRVGSSTAEGGRWSGSLPDDAAAGAAGCLPGVCSARVLAERSGIIRGPLQDGVTDDQLRIGAGGAAPSAGDFDSEQSPSVVLRRSSLTGKAGDLSPGFQSAAALAGWDYEALLQAALGEDEITPVAQRTPQPVHRTPEPVQRHAGHVVACGCGLCPSCTDRKRAVRTPSHASTPASANRRHRRHRTQIIEQSFVDLPPIGLLNLCPETSIDEGVTTNNGERSQPQSESSPSLGNDGIREPMLQNDLLPDKENEFSAMNPDPGSCNTAKPSDDNKKQVSGQLACLDQLRDELSCAVCLEICFEPSTTSCGHSFCRSCLASSLDRCGPRCPKCRQFLREDVKVCPLNTTLWNTIQLLFPSETSAKQQERSRRPTPVDTGSTSRPASSQGLTHSDHFLSTVASRAVRNGPWRNPAPPLRPPPPPPPAFLPPLTTTSLSSRSRSVPMRLYFSLRGTRGSSRIQEQEDMFFARRLQSEENRQGSNSGATPESTERRPLYEQNIMDRSRANNRSGVLTFTRPGSRC